MVSFEHDGCMVQSSFNKEPKMKYKNINGTGGRTPPAGYGSWLEYYMTVNGLRTVPSCGRLYCGEKAEVGAHVKKVNSTDSSWYIVPLCAGCNKLTDEFELKCDVKPVKVNP